MSAPDREFTMLAEGFANRELTAAEDQRLRELAAGDPAREADLAEIRRLHGLFAQERELFGELGGPAEPGEEADPGYARLNRAAAAAGDELRARLLHPVRNLPIPAGARRRVRAVWLSVAAAVVAVAAGLFALFGGGADGLIGTAPGDSSLGGAVPRILLDAELRGADPVLRWHAVVGATRYDAVIEDADGEIVLRRPQERTRSTVWQLSSEQFTALRDHVAVTGAALLLRIVARDGSGAMVASSSDVPLTLVD